MTIDAMGCQKEIAKQIVEGDGDYVLAVKPNQPKLYEQVEQAIDRALEQGAEKVDEHVTVETGHGRHETRTYAIIAAPSRSIRTSSGATSRPWASRSRSEKIPGTSEHRDAV